MTITQDPEYAKMEHNLQSAQNLLTAAKSRNRQLYAETERLRGELNEKNREIARLKETAECLDREFTRLEESGGAPVDLVVGLPLRSPDGKLHTVCEIRQVSRKKTSSLKVIASTIFNPAKIEGSDQTLPTLEDE